MADKTENKTRSADVQALLDALAISGRVVNGVPQLEDKIEASLGNISGSRIGPGIALDGGNSEIVKKSGIRKQSVRVSL